ncbi:hypothetical protein [Streptomyces sp. NPDC058964]|uniref:hypothetical protein n=1 Tax=Streptomyces sp. NPDC058964 TaxID=3346681 RepID=UPI0036886E11
MRRDKSAPAWATVKRFAGRATVAVVLALGSAGCVTQQAPPTVEDPRACEGTTVGLDVVSSRFGLHIPDDAADLRFQADVHPLYGEYSLTLGFRTTRPGLQEFLDFSSFPKLVKSDEGLKVTPEAPDCASWKPSDDLKYAPSPKAEEKVFHWVRGAEVDFADPEHPYIAVVAMDE